MYFRFKKSSSKKQLAAALSERARLDKVGSERKVDPSVASQIVPNLLFEANEEANPVCPDGHELEQISTRIGGYFCEACGHTFPKATAMFGCSKCALEASNVDASNEFLRYECMFPHMSRAYTHVYADVRAGTFFANHAEAVIRIHSRLAPSLITRHEAVARLSR